jgi:hypothetical protein
MNSYRVRYRVVDSASSTNATATIMLHSGSESEAITALKQRGTVRKDADVIILSIEKL